MLRLELVQDHLASVQQIEVLCGAHRQKTTEPAAEVVGVPAPAAQVTGCDVLVDDRTDLRDECVSLSLSPGADPG